MNDWGRQFIKQSSCQRDHSNGRFGATTGTVVKLLRKRCGTVRAAPCQLCKKNQAGCKFDTAKSPFPQSMAFGSSGKLFNGTTVNQGNPHPKTGRSPIAFFSIFCQNATDCLSIKGKKNGSLVQKLRRFYGCARTANRLDRRSEFSLPNLRRKRCRHTSEGNKGRRHRHEPRYSFVSNPAARMNSLPTSQARMAGSSR